jgi:hypothetical protein
MNGFGKPVEEPMNTATRTDRGMAEAVSKLGLFTAQLPDIPRLPFRAKFGSGKRVFQIPYRLGFVPPKVGLPQSKCWLQISVRVLQRP